jgi:acetolactate synthase small subunit
MASNTTGHHILTVTVENKPGVLSRVAGLFSRRAFNIFSLAVSPTDDERFSRMTIVVDAESAPLEQIVKQLNKLIPVIKITEVAPGEGVERELLLVTVQAASTARSSMSATIHSRSWSRASPTSSTRSATSPSRSGSSSSSGPAASRWPASPASP